MSTQKVYQYQMYVNKPFPTLASVWVQVELLDYLTKCMVCWTSTQMVITCIYVSFWLIYKIMKPVFKQNQSR